MNKFAAAVIVLTLTPQLADATPFMFFNNSNGAVYLRNDTGAPLASIWIDAPAGHFQSDPALFARFPGAAFDDGDLPFRFTYLNFPTTDNQYGVHIGNILKPGMPASFWDFYGFYREGSLLEAPKPVGIIQPEPSSCVMAILAIVAMCATGRKFSPRT